MRPSLLAQVEISLLFAAILASTAPLVSAQSPDFSIVANPSSSCIAIGSSTTYKITVSSIDGYSGQVLIGDDIQPNVDNGPSLSPIPSSVTLSSDQKVTFDLSATTTSSTPNQVYTITVAGIGGSTLHSAPAYLAFAPNCGTVGGTAAPTTILNLATSFIGLAVITSATAGTLSFAFIRTKQKRTRNNQQTSAL